MSIFSTPFQYSRALVVSGDRLSHHPRPHRSSLRQFAETLPPIHAVMTVTPDKLEDALVRLQRAIYLRPKRPDLYTTVVYLLHRHDA
jgi:hypothetical protein